MERVSLSASTKTRSKIFHKSKWWKYVLSLLICIIYLLPVYVLINMSFKQFTDMTSRMLPPTYLFLDNFKSAFFDGDILTAFKNTIIITVSVVSIEVVFGCMAAYALARKNTRLTRMVSAFCMSVMMIPSLSILVGVYTEIVSFGGVNQYWGLIAISSSFGLPLSIFLFSNFIRSIPVELDEAAAIDGAGVLHTFWSIILPQLKPVTVSVVILKGVGAWNDYLYPSYILQKTNMYTLTLKIKQYFGSQDNSSDLHGAAAVAVLCILPVIVIYLCLQKYFIQGQMDSAIK